MQIIQQHLLAEFADPLEQAAALPLSFDARKRSRQRLTLDDGSEIAIALGFGTVLNPGDVLVADDGQRWCVSAAPESVLRVSSDDPWLLTRAAYHLGNRHTPVAVLRDALLIEPDPVLRDMLEGIGLTVESCEVAFTPEPGAYGGGHRHGHDETFAEDHALAQTLFTRHANPNAHD
jgi:urease accessory protein